MLKMQSVLLGSTTFATMELHPQSSSVARTKEQERIRIVKEGLSRMRKRQLPSNAEVQNALHHVQTGETHQEISQRISSDSGKRALSDFDNVLAKTEKLLEKNKEEHLQQMIYHAHKARSLTDRETLLTAMGEQGSDLRANLSFSYQSFVNAIKLFITSNQFRNAIKGLLSVLADILKYNIGGMGNAPSLSNYRNEMAAVAKGERSGREAGHHLVDLVADTANSLFPGHVRDELSQATKPHMESVRTGDVSATQAARGAMRDTYNVFKSRAYQMDVPPEYKDALVDRLKQSLIAFHSHPEFQKALDDSLTGVTNVITSSKAFSLKGKETVKETQSDVEWKTTFDHAKALIENFFNGKSLSGLIDAIRTFLKDVANDNMLQAVFQGWITLIRRMLSDTDYVTSNAFQSDARQLSDSTGSLMSERHRDHATKVIAELKDFFSGLAEDPVNQEFAGAVRQLWTDVFLDENGNFTIKKDLMNDVASIIPILSQHLAYIPVPRFEKDDENMSIAIDELILRCDKLIPGNIESNIHTHLDVANMECINTWTLEMSHIQMSADNAYFTVHKKTGFPRFNETGRVDFNVYNRGVSIRIAYVPWVRHTANGFEKGLELRDCDVRINKLYVKIHDTENHHLLYRIFRTIIQRIIKRTLGQIVSDYFRKLLDPAANEANDTSDGKVQVHAPFSGSANAEANPSQPASRFIVNDASNPEGNDLPNLDQRPTTTTSTTMGNPFEQTTTSLAANKY